MKNNRLMSGARTAMYASCKWGNARTKLSGFRASVLLAAFTWFAAFAATGEDAAAPATAKVRIVLVGDSTVNDEGGWGYGFKLFLNDNAECINTALNGRSSKSFIGEGHWQPALDLKGDYYLIQFGHNDEPGKGPDRETDPATTYSENLKRYVDNARAIGGKPVLVTSLTRRNFEKSGNGRLVTNLMPYVEAMKRVAAEKNVPLIDLHARSVEWCEKIGPEETAKFNPLKDGKPDTTHLKGAARVVFARLVADELRKAVPELKPYLLATPKPEPPGQTKPPAAPVAPNTKHPGNSKLQTRAMAMTSAAR